MAAELRNDRFVSTNARSAHGRRHMIKRLRVNNYRSLAEIDLTLEPITVLVGQNGSGKSNLVDVLRFVADALQNGLDSAVKTRNGMDFIRRWSTRSRSFDVEVKLTLDLAGSQIQYGFGLNGKQRGEFRVKSEQCSFQGEHGAGHGAGYELENGQWVRRLAQMTVPLQSTSLVLPLVSGVPPYEEVYRALTGMSFYNIVPREVARPQRALKGYPLDARGENLAAALQALDPSARQSLQLALHRATGDITNYQVSQVGGYLVTKLHHEWSDGERASPNFELAQESDGTVRLLGILTALMQSPPRTLIAIEEPELTIHPGALRILWEEILDSSVRTQILLTTHSPDLLDMCTADQLRVVEKEDGITRIGPIAEEQREIIRKRLAAPGQLLQAQGLQRSGTN